MKSQNKIASFEQPLSFKALIDLKNGSKELLKKTEHILTS